MKMKWEICSFRIKITVSQYSQCEGEDGAFEAYLKAFISLWLTALRRGHGAGVEDRSQDCTIAQ